MKKITNILISFGFVFILAGCGTGSMVVLLPDPDGNVGQIVVANEAGKQVLTEANQSVQAKSPKEAPGEVQTLSNNEIQSIFSEALAAQPQPPAKFILYFLKDSDDLTSESKAIIPQIIQTMKERDSNDIVISGHTDKTGSMEYNYKLSLNRAQAVYKILVSNVAFPSYITVTSHGEGNPLIKTADGVAEPRNRRVEIVIR